MKALHDCDTSGYVITYSLSSLGAPGSTITLKYHSTEKNICAGKISFTDDGLSIKLLNKNCFLSLLIKPDIFTCGEIKCEQGEIRFEGDTSNTRMSLTLNLMVH